MNTPRRRVLALAPMPPEKSAYALARYSRSPDSIEDSLRWVHGNFISTTAMPRSRTSGT